MGNAIAKKVDSLPKEHTATAGHCRLWKLWPGKLKETGEEVCVWTFDKGDLAKLKTPITDKNIIEQIFQIMRKDCCILRDCSSCGSSIVNVRDIIDDGSKSSAIVFITEPVVCSLADLLSTFEGISDGKSLHSCHFDVGGALSEIEISRGIANITEGLMYFHSVQRKLHNNVNPESCLIMQSGSWKLGGGFGLSLAFQGVDQMKLPSPYFLKPITSTLMSLRLEPDVRYSAPELTIGGYSHSSVRYITPTADVFSVAIMAYEVYAFNLNKSMNNRTFEPIVPVTSNNALMHHTALTNLTKLDFNFMNPKIGMLLRGMMTFEGNTRLSTSDVINNPYFVSGSLAVLRNIDTLHNRDIGSQSSILLSLANQLGDFPTRILQSTVLPIICKLCAQNTALWLYALPVHMVIVKKLPRFEYQRIVGPAIQQGLATINPAETMQIFLKNVKFLQSSFDKSFFQAHVISVLLCNSIEKQHVSIQTLAIQILCDKDVFDTIEKAVLSEKVIPKICKEACKNSEPTVKTLALYFLSLVANKLDKQYILANILPSLKYIKERESDSTVAMCVVGNFEVIAECVGPEYIASQILPTIQPLIVDRSLNKQQFEITVGLVKTLLAKVINVRASELGLPPANFGVDSFSSSGDPFAGAKELLALAQKKNQIVANTGVVNYDGSILKPSSSSNLFAEPPLPPSTPAPSNLPFSPNTTTKFDSIVKSNPNPIFAPSIVHAATNSLNAKKTDLDIFSYSHNGEKLPLPLEKSIIPSTPQTQSYSSYSQPVSLPAYSIPLPYIQPLPQAYGGVGSNLSANIGGMNNSYIPPSLPHQQSVMMNSNNSAKKDPFDFLDS